MITVRSPARLHIALLNESALLGRIDGGIGVAVASPAWHIKLGMQNASMERCTAGIEIEPELLDAAKSALSKYRAAFGLPNIHFSIQQRIPLHAGLGSKTSLLMALGRGLNRLLSVDWSSERIADFVGRTKGHFRKSSSI